MKPLKNTEPFALWILKIVLLLWMIISFWDDVKQIDVNHLSVYYILITVYFLFGVLLFISGFTKNTTLSVFSGLMIFLLSLYFVVKSYHGTILDIRMITYLFPVGIGLLFVSNGK